MQTGLRLENKDTVLVVDSIYTLYIVVSWVVRVHFSLGIFLFCYFLHAWQFSLTQWARLGWLLVENSIHLFVKLFFFFAM